MCFHTDASVSKDYGTGDRLRVRRIAGVIRGPQERVAFRSGVRAFWQRRATTSTRQAPDDPTAPRYPESRPVVPCSRSARPLQTASPAPAFSVAVTVAAFPRCTDNVIVGFDNTTVAGKELYLALSVVDGEPVCGRDANNNPIWATVMTDLFDSDTGAEVAA